ncbi:DUF4175 family protein [Taibaiella soli]|uniref:DUF4175 domain-containing protein n=1 Tax=Taibaiella soli TaxID=1649169 RepID=A0A2W2ABE0_9BACT|nr:DUF4175 family protein [Taibaiella soli]PZF70932.1 hypothetical protein DN068_21135 [Taibaiella soli]
MILSTAEGVILQEGFMPQDNPMNNYDRLISSLDAFIRKYYANQLIRGSLLLLICLLLYILTASLSEYYFYLPVWLKVTIVTLFVGVGSFALIAWVIIPLLRMSKLGKVISHETAAVIIGRHFPEVSDKLLNILQLKQHSETNASQELIAASIDQKASQISVVPFAQAVDFTKNKKLLPYLLPLLLIGVFILIAAPNVFKDASERLLQPTKTFEKPAPFRFVILSNPLQASRNSDFTLQVSAEGNALPAEMAVDLNGEHVPMQSIGASKFQYTFKNMTDAVSFRLFAAGFYSQSYTIKVAQKPLLKAFKVQIDYPEYIGKKDEIRNSLGDMTLPVGTTVRWGFIAEHTDDAHIRFANGSPINLPANGGMFGYSFRFMNDTSYTLLLKNKQSIAADSFQYHVQIIPDQFPVIQLQEHRDTVSGKQILLTGTAGDDYGVSKVVFNFSISNEKGQALTQKSIPLKITPGALTTFQHYFDVDMLQLQSGQKLSYYIEAWDNDGVHGAKASRSEVMTFQMFNNKQLDSAINANAQQINSGLSNSAQQTEKLQDQYKDMQSKMLNSDKSDWEQQQSLQELLKKQQQLQSQVENAKKRFEEQMQQSEQKQYSQDVKDKQEDLKKQMDNLLNKELQEQIKKLQDLIQKMNKEQPMQTMQQLEQDNKLFNMDLQRMQELMKQLEMQMRLEDLVSKMDDLAKKQLELKDQTDKNKKGNDALSKDQQDLKKDLDKAMQGDMKDLNDLNKKMQTPQDMQQSQQQGQQAQQNMQQSDQSLQQNQNSKSSQSQSKAAQNLQQMADMMRQQAGGMNMQQIEMDIRAVRQILTNLMRLSFDQEKLMKNVQQTSVTSQEYLANQTEQNRLHSNSYMIRDSLFSLSKRLSKLSATVNKETTELEKNMKYSLDALENRRVGEALTRQQYVMTRANNLALMLNEMLANLMQMQAQAQNNPGKGSCNNPGGMNPKPGAGKQLSDIITKQQQLGNAMQQMQGAQQGKQPGGQQQGQQPGQQGQQQGQGQKGNQQGGEGGLGSQGNSASNEYGNSEQLARMAEQQAELRRQLNELNSLLNSKGLGNAKELREIQDKMDKNEADLVNRRLGSEFQMRQKEIMTRLLEAEKSLREQEQDDKRSSNTAKEISRPVPPELQKYMQDRQKLLELYKTVPPQLKPYYKNMVEQYYQMIGNK